MAQIIVFLPNYGPGINFIQQFFSQGTKWDRHLLVEDPDAIIIYDTSGEFWWHLIMYSVLYCAFNFVTVYPTLATKWDQALYETGHNLK